MTLSSLLTPNMWDFHTKQLSGVDTMARPTVQFKAGTNLGGLRPTGPPPSGAGCKWSVPGSHTLSGLAANWGFPQLPPCV